MMERFVLRLMVLSLLLGSCSEPVPVATSSNVSSALATTTSAASTVPTTAEPTPTQLPTTVVGLDIPEVLKDFATVSVRLDGIVLQVAVADTGELRQQGLMGIEDLGDLDGMLFVFDRDSSGGFWMKDTLIALDIAFFDADGGFVDGFVMEPCVTADCPTYRPSGSYRYAVEMVAGTMPTGVERFRFEQ